MFFFQTLLNRFISIFFRILYKKKFLHFGDNSRILSPLKISGTKFISIGKNVFIASQTWLEARPLDSSSRCELVIGDGTCIGHFNHIYATSSIEIGNNVLIADKVYISDNLHSYENINLPIMYQPIKQLSSVHIGDGTWIGENVCVLGASIGKNCVIGANAVVNSDIPDYCVAVGIPARIIKKYNFDTLSWERIL